MTPTLIMLALKTMIAADKRRRLALHAWRAARAGTDLLQVAFS